MSLRVRLLFSFPHYQILAITIILSLVGVSEIVLSVLGYVQKIWGYEMGGGIWGGAAAFVAGVLGILAANKKGVGIVRVFLISSILSCFLSIPLVVLSAGGLDFNSGFYRNIQGYMKIDYSSTKLVHGFLLALAVAQFTICLTTTLVCLKHLYWNEWVIKRQHARHLRQIKEENKANRHRASRASTSSSAPLVARTSGENPNRRHRRHKHRTRPRSRSSENCSHGNDSVVNQALHSDTPDERRHRESRRRENRPDAPNFHAATSADDPLISDASRVPEVGSRLMSVNSTEIPAHNVRSSGYDSLRSFDEHEHLQPPLPIEDDEELPPYEASLRPVDDESVFPMSISENASCRSSTISSGDEVQAWDSVSQIQKHKPTSPTHSDQNCVQETDVKYKYCPTASVLSDSSSLPIGSNIFINSKNNKKFGNNNDQTVSENKMTDPQGVSYHEFTRDSNKIMGKEKQRTQSFLRERAMAKEGAKCASRKSSVQENSDREDDKYNIISPLDYQEIQQPCFIPQTSQPPPKPPRKSVTESCTMHEKLQQKGSDFLQNKYDSNDSTSSLSKDIQFIKEGPPMQNVPSPEQKLPETLTSPFSEVSWHLIKDFPSNQSPSELKATMGAKPKIQYSGAVPLHIQNRVVTSELHKAKVLSEQKQSLVSESPDQGQRQSYRLPRFPHPPKSTKCSTVSPDKYPKGFLATPNSSNRKENGQSFSLTAVNISNFSPTQTSTMKKDNIKKPKAAPTSGSDSSQLVPFGEKSDSSIYKGENYALNSNPDVSKDLISSQNETQTEDTLSKKHADINVTNESRIGNNLSMANVSVANTSKLPVASANKEHNRDDCGISDALMPFKTGCTPLDGSNTAGGTGEVGAYTTTLSNTQQTHTQRKPQTTFTQQTNSTQPYPSPPSLPSQAQASTGQFNKPKQNPPQPSNPTQQNPPQASNPTQQNPPQLSNPTQQNPPQMSNSTRQNPPQPSNPTQQNPSQLCNPTQQNPPQLSNPTQQNPPQLTNPTQQNPSQLSNPTQQNPSQPKNPTQQNPSQLSNPTQKNPSQPTNPTQQNPSQLSNPTQQNHSQPTNPTQQNPSQPSNPTQQNPSQPTNRTQQNPSQPSNPTQQNPSQPSNPTQQSKPMYSLLL